MRLFKHLPELQWPAADCRAFEEAFRPGDPFDETGGPGAHLTEGSQNSIRMGYRRWLGFLHANHPDALLEAAGRPHLARAGSRVHRRARLGNASHLGAAITTLAVAADCFLTGWSTGRYT
jgi:hypothetical protein